MKINATQLDASLPNSDTFERTGVANSDTTAAPPPSGTDVSTNTDDGDVALDDAEGNFVNLQNTVVSSSGDDLSDGMDDAEMASLVTAQPQQLPFASLDDATPQVQTSAAALNGTGGSLVLTAGTAHESSPSAAVQLGSLQQGTASLGALNTTVLSNLRSSVAQLPQGAQRDALLGQLDTQLASSSMGGAGTDDALEQDMTTSATDQQQQNGQQQDAVQNQQVADQQLQDQVLQQQLQFEADRRTNRK